VQRLAQIRRLVLVLGGAVLAVGVVSRSSQRSDESSEIRHPDGSLVYLSAAPLQVDPA
jgi:hypothetical protein